MLLKEKISKVSSNVYVVKIIKMVSTAQRKV